MSSHRLVLMALVLIVGVSGLLFADDLAVTMVAQTSVAFTGYLTDVACGTSGKSPVDGSDLVNSPWDHTKACSIVCAGSGYGVSVQNGKSFNFIPFDSKGNELAAAILKSTSKDQGVSVAVMGVLSNGVIMVSSMVESNT
jgi:hypothetical protein